MSLNDILGKKEEDIWRNKEKSIFSIIFNEVEANYFNRLITMLSNYISESNIILKDGKMIFKIINADRIIIANIVKKINYDDDKVKIGIDFDDFSKITTPKKKNIKISFLEDKVIVEKINKKGYYVSKELGLLKLELEKVEINPLLEIIYENSFSITKENLMDLFSEVGNYSNIIKIEVNDEGVCFSEEGNNGNFQYPILKQDLLEYKCINLEGEIVMILFDIMKKMKPVFDLLEDNDKITFYLKYLHPLRLSIYLDNLILIWISF